MVNGEGAPPVGPVDILVEGNYCMKNGGTIDGDIFIGGGGEFYAKNNSTINGTITAEGDVDVGQNTTVNAVGEGAIAGFGGLYRFTFLEMP